MAIDYCSLISLLIVICLCYFLIKLTRNILRTRKTQIFTNANSTWNQFLNKSAPVVDGYANSPFWFFNSYFSTIGTSYIRRRIRPVYRRHIIEFDDGGQLALDIVDNSDPISSTILILPGLTGNSNATYITHLSKRMSEEHLMRIVVMNYRGIKCELKTMKSYSATYIDDLVNVIDYVKKEFNQSKKLYVIGNSLGGLLLGNYLRRTPNTPIDCAIMNSSPFDLFKTSENLDGFINNFLYIRYLLNNLKEMVKKYHATHYMSLVDFTQIQKTRTVKEFDNILTAPLFGYRNVDEYYNDALLIKSVELIKTKTLFINANDDDFSPESAIPFDHIKQNENLALILIDGGGHLGFAQNNKSLSYAEDIIEDVLFRLDQEN
ncbi:hypothetical protein SNEBB_003434 [Seison nebaliae]|nr:hypothetical protein SNEBB_003434 [Seison nebaliae]